MTGAPLVLILLAALGAAAALAVAADLRRTRRRRVAHRLAVALGAPDADPSADLRTALARAASAALAPVGATLSRAFFARERERAEMAALLVSAGFRGPGAMRMLAGAKFGGALLGGGLGLLAAGGGLLGAASGMQTAALVGGGAMLGAIAPEMAVRRLAAARKERLRDALPDVIDLLVIASYAGQSLDMALDKVSRELADFSPDMAGELSIVTAELQALPDRSLALENFAERLAFAEARAFTMTLSQTIRYGAPFSQPLKLLGGDLRQARIIALEERGAKLPALLTLPLIVFIMPAVFVVVVGPAALSMMALFE